MNDTSLPQGACISILSKVIQSGALAFASVAFVFLGEGSAQEPLTYESHIRPIFAEHCFACHGPDKQSSSFRLDRKSSALQGGDYGEPAIVPGDSDQSPLWHYVRDAEHANAMPPPGADRRRLNEVELDTIQRWIDAGANWIDSEPEVNAMDHWSYRPLQGHFVYDSIDAFLDAKRDEAGLATTTQATPEAIIRRLSFALTGLPPEPTQVQSFVQEYRVNEDLAVERLVDTLLASPQYGERWARHWLDVVRFAESDGFEMNHPRPNAWPYRDYVIDVFNRDKPYDLFVKDQLAGDRWGVDAATGFLVGGPWDRVKSPDPVLTANQRADELHDMVSTTASAFLGLTVGCARCHTHKFDPISQHDYYRIKACLSGVQHGERELATAPAEERVRELAECEWTLREIQKELRLSEPLAVPGAVTPTRSAVSHRENVERFAPAVARWLRFEISATTDAEPCIDELEIFSTAGINVARNATITSSGDYPNSPIHRLVHINDGRYGNDFSWISNEMGRGWILVDLGSPTEIDTVLWSRDRSTEPRFADRVATKLAISVSVDEQAWTVVADATDRMAPNTPPKNDDPLAPLRQQRIELERRMRQLREGPMVYAGKMESPEKVYRFHRGDPMAPKEPIAPGGLEAFASFSLPLESSDIDRRVALADWIASPTHPLTARVMVNRLWHYHFGTGIVDTPSDFGKGGSHPSHPELLDWLATQFIEQGWSVKQMQRWICNARVYRLDSQPPPESRARDSGNRWLSYFPARRLEAEPLRDTLLSVSGQLDLKMGGPGFDLFEPNENYVRVYETKVSYGPAEFRRMIYQRKPRVELDQIFGTFDCPDAGQIQPKRNVSTTPLQALNLLNSQFMIDQSLAFAERLARECGDPMDEQIERAYLLAFSRHPTDRERSLCREFIQEQGLTAFCRGIFNANEFIMVY